MDESVPLPATSPPTTSPPWTPLWLSCPISIATAPQILVRADGAGCTQEFLADIEHCVTPR